MKQLLCLSLLAVSLLSHADGSLKLKKNMSYKQARTVILKAKWQPAGAESSQDAGLPDEIFKRFPEAESCAGTGEGPCNLIFKSADKRILTVHTVGGLDGDARDTAVTSWEIDKQ